MYTQPAPTLQAFKDRIHETVIAYPRFLAFHELMGECMELSIGACEPRSMAIEAMTGAGKTTLLAAFAAQFPRMNQAYGTIVPVFHARTPSPVTPKGLVVSLLLQLGDPIASQGTTTAQTTRLVYQLRDCQTQLVLLDDFHHLIDAKTDRVLSEIAEWLKDLIKTTGIPFVVCGVDDRVFRILKHPRNAQLSRLFPVREVLRPFNREESQEGQPFHTLLNLAQEAVETTFAADLRGAEFLWRMYYATDGVVGHTINLMRDVAITAFKQDLPDITLAMLAHAFDRTLAHHLSWKVNPFVTPLSQAFVEPSTASDGA